MLRRIIILIALVLVASAATAQAPRHDAAPFATIAAGAAPAAAPGAAAPVR